VTAPRPRYPTDNSVTTIPGSAEEAEAAGEPDAVKEDRPAEPAGEPAATGVEDRPGRQYGLDVLRLAAICGVVAIHVLGTIVSDDRMHGSASWWVATTIDLGAVWTVPVFVMISGALTLSPRVHAAGPVAFYRRRFARILPALIFWHIVYLFIARPLIRGEELPGVVVARMFIDAKVFTALYFLWLIAGLYIVAPVLAAFLAGGGQRRAVTTAAVAMGFTLIAFATAATASLLGFPRPIHLGALTYWWPYVGYFVAGWALHRVVLSRRATVLAGVAAIVLLAEGVWQWAERPYLWLQALLPISYLGASVVVASICLFLVAVNVGRNLTPPPWAGRLLRRLSEASFGVFLVHMLIFVSIERLVPAVERNTSLPVMVVTYVAVVVLSFAISLGAARVPYVRAVF
jgi:surface polysaccharide O-acyltransferase-like enzyme